MYISKDNNNNNDPAAAALAVLILIQQQQQQLTGVEINYLSSKKETGARRNEATWTTSEISGSGEVVVYYSAL